MINKMTNPGDVVLDAFSGSGTVAIAGMLTGRKVIAIERSLTYCQETVKRLQRCYEDNELVLA